MRITEDKENILLLPVDSSLSSVLSLTMLSNVSNMSLGLGLGSNSV
jgi:hypothetical protein